MPHLSPLQYAELNRLDRTEAERESFWQIVARCHTVSDLHDMFGRREVRYLLSRDWRDIYSVSDETVFVCADCGHIVAEDSSECDQCGYDSVIAAIGIGERYDINNSDKAADDLRWAA